MSPLPVNTCTSNSYVGGDDSVPDKETSRSTQSVVWCYLSMGAGNSQYCIEMEKDSTEMARNVLAETNNSTENSGETLISDEISPAVCSLTEEKGYSKKINVDIDPNNLSVSKSCVNVITGQTPELTGSHLPSEPIQHNSVKVTNLILMESDKVTRSESECQLVDGNLIDVKEKDLETYCESLKYVNKKLRNSIQHSIFEAESSSDSHICREKIETNSLSNIVNNECADCDNPHKFDNDVEDKNVKIKSATETLHSKFTKPSVGESIVQNISDSVTNLSTGTLNEVLEDIESLALKEKKAELDKIGLVKRPSKFIEGTEKKTVVFVRGSFPRISVKDTGGIGTIKRLQRRLLKEKEKREMLLSKCVLRKRPVQKNIRRKNKNILIGKDQKRDFSEKAGGKTTKIKLSTNDIKLKKLQVRLKRIDEKLLSKYNVDLNNLYVNAAINRNSNENNQSLKASNLSENEIQNLELPTRFVLQNDKTIGVEENMILSRKEDDMNILLKKQTHEAKLKHVSVRVLKIDDYTLSKYGYSSQKLKTSNAAIITHRKTGREDNLGEKKTNHVLNLNNVKYPAQILLSKIDVNYPNILKQTLKINMNEKNKNSKNSIGVKKKTKVSPKNIKSDSRNDLRTLQICIPKIDNKALSKSDVVLKTSCNDSKIKSKANTKDRTIKSSDVRQFDTHSQETFLKNIKTDLFNDVKIDSKENLNVNGEPWDLKQAKVRLMKLDNSVLPKFLSPVIKINPK